MNQYSSGINEWYPVLSVQILEEQNNLVAIRLLEEDIVLWKTNNQVYAWQDRCIHRGTRLSMGYIDQSCLVCPYHGWQYDQTGQCIYYPSHPSLKPSKKVKAVTYHAQIAYSMVWVCLGQPAYDLPPFSEWNDQGYRQILCGAYQFKATGVRIVENFLDVAHFAFIHPNRLGTVEQTEIPDYQVVTNENGITASNIRVFQPNPDGSGKADWVTYTYKVYRPLVAYFRKEGERKLAILLMVTPIDEANSLVWMAMATNQREGTEEELRQFQDEIVEQDRQIVESQRLSLSGEETIPKITSER
ncbi:MAG: Rieske 2Fe-2S domain-containing protein [Microcystaceae cyanobacterium]